MCPTKKILPNQFFSAPSKEALKKTYVGKHVAELPTPSLLIDRPVFAANCQRMLENAAKLKVDFRCHIKTHKTVEGTLLELGYGLDGNPYNATSKIVVSTLAEAWATLPLIQDKKIDNVLYGLPVAKLRLGELYEFSKVVPTLIVMTDSVEQIDAMVEFSRLQSIKWNIFIKVDVGTARAGRVYDSSELRLLIEHSLSADVREHVSIYGLYGHCGHSYKARDKAAAQECFVEEVKKTSYALKVIREIDLKLRPVVSVGATPTAHFASEIDSTQTLQSILGEDSCENLELHAGNYACCDLQQVGTGLVAEENTSLFVLAEVLSSYPQRNNFIPGEQLINAGCIALGREPGPFPGFGKIVDPLKYGQWIVKSVSQEHGILSPEQEDCSFIPYGTKVKILPQHACITAAAHGWYFAVENDVVVDVWLPTKYW